MTNQRLDHITNQWLDHMTNQRPGTYDQLPNEIREY